MTTVARIVSNLKKGDGDWIVILIDGEVCWEGHSLPRHPKTFVTLATFVGQADLIVYHDLTNDEIQNWEDYL